MMPRAVDANESRDRSLAELNKLASALKDPSRAWLLPQALYETMRSACGWAVECWMAQSASLGWHDQEARFLRIAPGPLRDRYLAVTGEARQLTLELDERLGEGEFERILVSAESLGDWRERALAWHGQALDLVEKLTSPRAKRIERGKLNGAPNSLTPCLVVTGGGARDLRWHRAGSGAGVFYFARSSGRCHGGLILPLSLCRKPQLKQTLLEFWQEVSGVPPHLAGTDSDAAWRRREALQNWLDSRGLNCLRLTEREPTDSWIGFELASDVFETVLCHFDYVSAVGDEAGGATKLLEHRPFRFRSQGELWQWARDVEEFGWGHSFNLYLVGDIAVFGDIGAGLPERRKLLRPVEYALRYALPDPSIAPSPVSVELEQAGYGWIDLRIALGDLTASITLSDAHDPFPVLLEWLQVIATGDLPVTLEIDEESARKKLLAHAFGRDRLLFAVLDARAETEFVAGVVERATLLDAFRRELTGFFQDSKRFDPSKWRRADDSRGQRYPDGILGHVFLAGMSTEVSTH